MLMKTALKAKFLPLFAILVFSLADAYCQSNVNNDDKNLVILFKNFFGDKPLELERLSYKGVNGEQIIPTEFKYFVSNLVLTRFDGNRYIVPQNQSYFLIKAGEDGSQKILLNVPSGKYAKLDFILGVDSLRSTMDISERTGALDVTGGMNDGMYWTWNSGYIFLKFEGLCEQLPVDFTGQKKFRYHIGGFGGVDKQSVNNIRKVELSFPHDELLLLEERKQGTIAIKADASKLLSGKTNVKIAEHPQVMFGAYSGLIADNYSSMFSLISISH